MSFTPTKITGYSTGLVQEREQFLLPADAYPVLENAFCWRDKIVKKQGVELLGRLRRKLLAQGLGVTNGSGNLTVNIVTTLGLESTAEIEKGSVTVDIGADSLTEDSATTNALSGLFGTATLNYTTGELIISGSLAGTAVTIDFNYFPNLPVMGLLKRELTGINAEDTIAFDTTYAYRYNSGWEEFIPGFTWTGTNADFFWGTNWWVDSSNRKLFWVTNFSGTTGDPIRYTNGTTWTTLTAQIDGSNFLHQSACLVPFRGRLFAFNTYEGATLAGSTQYRQRIRASAIGSPFATDAWRSDKPGKGIFIDIPTAENIISVGFVRDNLVVFCEQSTWLLRYTGRSIQPVQIEKVNTELGVESRNSLVQFDTSIFGVGGRGIVSCDSFKCDRIDQKIVDLAYTFKNSGNDIRRVHGVRDYKKKVAYWTYPTQEDSTYSVTFPNRRLVYNYENESWAIFKDSFTAFGQFQLTTRRKWSDTHQTWQSLHEKWGARVEGEELAIAGNQRGFVFYLDQLTQNDQSLSITAITGNDTDPTVITVPNNNLQSGDIIKITGIVSQAGTVDFTTLNNGIFSVDVDPANPDNLELYTYNARNDQFSDPQTDQSIAVYVGNGVVRVRDNFDIISKQFNNWDDGQTVVLRNIDILTNQTTIGAFQMLVYVDYDNVSATNKPPQNSEDDTFFNSEIETFSATGNEDLKKIWNRVFVNQYGSSIQIRYNHSNKQMSDESSDEFLEIDSQILYTRNAGRELVITP